MYTQILLLINLIVLYNYEVHAPIGCYSFYERPFCTMGYPLLVEKVLS
jgi:hypothetical protein